MGLCEKKFRRERASERALVAGQRREAGASNVLSFKVDLIPDLSLEKKYECIYNVSHIQKMHRKTRSNYELIPTRIICLIKT